MSYIDILIPGVLGALMVFSPGVFTKAQGETYVAAKKKLRTIGLLLLVVAASYAVIRTGQGA